jgi:DNA (cytosine-5)-methyltransferase 1
MHDESSRSTGLTLNDTTTCEPQQPCLLSTSSAAASPCQDISVAGRGAGLAGSRSGLWREFARIIGEVKPSWVLIENVPALRSRGLGVVLRDLAALGFDAEWDCLPASAFGAPHRRDRIFVVAYAERERVRLEQRGSSGARGDGAIESARDGIACNVANAESNGRQQRLDSQDSQDSQADCGGSRVFERVPSRAHAWSVEPDVGRVAHGVSARVDRLRCLGNAVVPQVAEHVGRLILAAS